MQYVIQMLDALNKRIETVEARAVGLIDQLQKAYTSLKAAHENLQVREDTVYGMMTALCVSTRDPTGNNRVAYFNPHFYGPETAIEDLRWANPISPQPGFDDTGCTWVPPAGTLICLLFAHGNRDLPYYFGSIWYDDKSQYNQGDQNPYIKFWSEYDELYKGHRGGYLIGPNDDSQCYPPWNTENINQPITSDNSIQTTLNGDGDTIYATLADIQAGMTYPNIYGWTTPGKWRSKFVDGQYDCSFRWSRHETISPLGQSILIKDDFLQPAGQWGALPKTGASPDESNEGCGCDSGVDLTQCPEGTNPAVCANPNFKNAQECRPIKGPGNPQNNKYMLPQSGIQWLTRSGHTWGGDDSVEDPQGVPNWERSLQDFDYGTTNVFKGKSFWISAHGDSVVINNEESAPGIPSENNGIFLDTLTGCYIHVNNHTNTDGTAGSKRGISIGSSSEHILEMVDDGNEQDIPLRKAGGVPINRSKAAYVNLRSGGGLQLMLNDGLSQTETADQFAYLYVPQNSNPERPGHMLRMQARANGPGQVSLTVGGNYICQTYDKHETVVGSNAMPSDKITKVHKNDIHSTNGSHIHTAKEHRLISLDPIQLLAGDDKSVINETTGEISQVPNPLFVVMWNPNRGLVASDRVLGTASSDARQIGIEDLMPMTAGLSNNQDDYIEK